MLYIQYINRLAAVGIFFASALSRHLHQDGNTGGDHCAGRRAKALHLFLPAKQRSSNGGREVNGHEMMESYEFGGLWEDGRLEGVLGFSIFECFVWC